VDIIPRLRRSNIAEGGRLDPNCPEQQQQCAGAQEIIVIGYYP
jgi:hypothetical protein